MTEQKNTRVNIMQAAMPRVEYYMHQIAENTFADTPTGAVLDDVLRSSGKMIRPGLLLLCGSFGPEYKNRLERLYMLAAMVELTHMASLIHDDIIDEAPFRRGVPSIQGKYGKAAAVYAGDFLISRIHYWQAKEQLGDASMILSKTIETMCAGEIGQALCRYREDITVKDYLNNITGKTASLFESSCEIGALEAGCCENTVKRLKKFGEYLGILFQFRDDLLDFTSSEKIEGKRTHKDFHDGIYTMPVLMALESEEGKEVLLPIMKENADRSLTTEEIALMEKEVIRLGGVKRTIEEIHRYASLAREILNSLKDMPAAKEIGRMLDQLESV